VNKHRADIIIINWNGKHFLKDCLESVLGQSYQNTNIVLVDNGSTDGSVEYVSSDFRNIRMISLKQNRGFTGANNIGIESGTGEFVALLNNDAVAHRNWLKESVDCLRLHPDAGFCASKIVNYYQRDILDAAGDLYTRGGVNAKRGLGRTIDFHRDFEYVFGACAAAVVYRRKMLREIGLFDEDFFVMCEDVDLSFRAQLAGYKCIYCPKAVVYHRTHETIKGINKVFSYYGQRNLEYVYFKNMPFGLFLSHLPAHIAYNVAVFFYFALNRQLLSFLKAKVDFLFNLPDVLRKRALIQKNSQISTRELDSLITGGWFLDKIRTKLLPITLQ
jgi:GT2 family glycosyltransferase